MRNDKSNNKEVMEIIMEMGLMIMSIMAVAAKSGNFSSDMEQKTLKCISAMQTAASKCLGLTHQELMDVCKKSAEKLHNWKVKQIEDQGMPEELADEIMDGKHGMA